MDSLGGLCPDPAMEREVVVHRIRDPLAGPDCGELGLDHTRHGLVLRFRRRSPYRRRMAARWHIELEPEVEQWLATIGAGSRERIEQALRRLEADGNRLGMPHSRSLGRGLFELRIKLGDETRRVTFRFGAGRTIVLLTTSAKQRHNERRQIARAREARRRSQDE